MDIKVRNSQQNHRSAANLKSALQKAREILSMATLSPLSYSRLQTPTGSTSDISDCASQSSEYGYSALHGAVISNDVEYLGFLLGSGCERLDQRDENGFTALHVATLQKSINGAQRLIKAGCDIEKPTKEGMSSLHIAVDLEDNDYLLCLLASSIPNINIRNKVGRTALHVAAKSGNQEYIKILLDFGCDREIKDKFGKKAVDIAKANSHDACVQVLLHYIAKRRVFDTQEDVTGNLRFQNGNVETTPLRDSLWKRHEETIKVDLGIESQKAITPSVNDIKEEHPCNALHCIPSEMETVVNGIKLEPHSNEDMVLSMRDVEETVLPLSSTRFINVSSVVMKQEEHVNEQDDLSTLHQATQDGEAKEHCEMTKESCLDKDTSITIAELFPQDDTGQSDTSELTGVFSHKVLDKENDDDEYDNNNEDDWDLGLSFQKLVEPSFSWIGNIDTLLHKQTRNGIYNSNNTSPCLPLKEAEPLYCETCVNRRSLKELNIVIRGICVSMESQNDLSSNLKIKKREVCELKHELQLFRASEMPLHVVCMTVDVLWRHKPSDMRTKHITFKDFQEMRTQPSDIIGQLLQGLKMTLNGSSHNHGKTLHGINGHQHIIEGLIDLFFRAIKLISIQQDNAYKMLDKFCSTLQPASPYRTLVHRIFTRSELIGDSVTSKDTTSETFESVLIAFEYILQHKKTSGPWPFVMSFLEIFISSFEYAIPAITFRPDFVEAVIQKAVNEEIWDEDKVAEVFVNFCDALAENVSLLCRFVDVLLSEAFTSQCLNQMTLSSCILVRMGLLKSEFEVKIGRQLKEALLALEHVFAQEYFPLCLAGLFSSFLVKPSPRFRKVNLTRRQALKAALLKEIVQPSMSLGKGLKRICDVIAQGDFWEAALRCCEALFEESFTMTTTLTAMEHGSSILVYFGLMKSEFPVQVINNIDIGLKLLRHAADRGAIPQSIAPMLVIFLKKGSSKIHLYKEEVQDILKLLTKWRS